MRTSGTLTQKATMFLDFFPFVSCYQLSHYIKQNIAKCTSNILQTFSQLTIKYFEVLYINGFTVKSFCDVSVIIRIASRSSIVLIITSSTNLCHEHKRRVSLSKLMRNISKKIIIKQWKSLAVFVRLLSYNKKLKKQGEFVSFSIH